jgi:hypothetical protein
VPGPAAAPVPVDPPDAPAAPPDAPPAPPPPPPPPPWANAIVGVAARKNATTMASILFIRRASWPIVFSPSSTSSELRRSAIWNAPSRSSRTNTHYHRERMARVYPQAAARDDDPPSLPSQASFLKRTVNPNIGSSTLARTMSRSHRGRLFPAQDQPELWAEVGDGIRR